MQCSCCAKVFWISAVGAQIISIDFWTDSHGLNVFESEIVTRRDDRDRWPRFQNIYTDNGNIELVASRWEARWGWGGEWAEEGGGVAINRWHRLSKAGEMWTQQAFKDRRLPNGLSRRSEGFWHWPDYHLIAFSLPDKLSSCADSLIISIGSGGQYGTGFDRDRHPPAGVAVKIAPVECLHMPIFMVSSAFFVRLVISVAQFCR